MSRILVADDSQTIQKVVKITLEEEGHELIPCLNEEELFKRLTNQSFDLLLLDFSLSKNMDGYQLAKKVQGINKDIKIIMMFSTFDSISKESLVQCGNLKYLIRPFESYDLLDLCKELLVFSKEDNIIETIEDDETNSDESEWVMELPKPPHQWEIEVPPVINSPTDLSMSHQEKPPIIDHLDDSPQDEDRFKELEKQIQDDMQSDDFWNSEDSDNKDGELFRENDSYQGIESEISQTQIKENVHHHDPEFSAVHLHEEHNLYNPPLPPIDLPQEECKNENDDANEEKVIDDFKKNLSQNLGPLLEASLKKHCTQIISKIAWEVIPDLAENLIKIELEKLGHSEKESDKP